MSQPFAMIAGFFLYWIFVLKTTKYCDSSLIEELLALLLDINRILKKTDGIEASINPQNTEQSTLNVRLHDKDKSYVKQVPDLKKACKVAG